MTTLYLQHGAGTKGPFLTEKVEYKITDSPHNYSISGYGAKIPTQYMVLWCNRWYRVYCVIYSNAGTLYIKTKSHGKIIVSDYG